MVGGKGGWLPTSSGGGGGGGTGSYPRTQSVRSGAGNVAINTGSAWADLSTYVPSVTDLTLTDCVAGDVVMATIANLWRNDTSNIGKLDVATMVGGAVTNLFSSGTSTPAADGGICWIAVLGGWKAVSGSLFYTLKSGDISSGSATFRVRVWTGGSRSLTFTGDQFAVTNLGPLT